MAVAISKTYSRSILALQHLAYQTEAAIYGDDTLPLLLDPLDDLIGRFENRRFLKAADDGRIIGSVRAYQDGETCYVERLIVHPDFRRRGFGTALLSEIELHFPTARRFELFTGHKSQANIRLYERLGYRAFRQQQVNEKVSLVFMEKEKFTIRLARLELVAATKELLLAEDDCTQLADGTLRQQRPTVLSHDGKRESKSGRMDDLVHPAS